MKTSLKPAFALSLFGLFLTFLLAACGGSGGTQSTAQLAGDPAAPALGALVNRAPQPVASGDIVNGLILTRLDVAITADATVGQVNAALGAVGGTIVSMRAGLPAVTVAIPRQSGPEAMRALANVLQAQPGIRAALLGREAKLNVAPPAAPANTDANFGYLQKAHFPAAWNARAAAGLCVNNKVTVIVADYFHRPIDVLYSDFATQVPGLTNLGTGSVDPANLGGQHGYDVLTTLAAKLDATVPTGANPFPDCLDLKAVQVNGLTSLEKSLAIDAALAATTGNVVINASYGFNDACGDPGDPCTPGNLTAQTAFDRALWGAWQRTLLEPFADRVLVVTPAGNEADEPVASVYPGTGLARVDSAFNVAATADSAMSFVTDTALWKPICLSPDPSPCLLLPNLTATPPEVAVLADLLADLDLTSAPRASNVMIVGSIDNSFNQSAFSDRGADVFAVGVGIPTLIEIPIRGTSLTAPQVSGLAAYLWMLSPELRARPVQDTIAAIKANASSDGIIDAYATVLSLDVPAPVTPSTAPRRLRILDVNDDGKFDQADLVAFLARYFNPVTGEPVLPQLPDHSSFDLNGNGLTGGTQATRMDLDPTGSTQFGQPVYSVVNQSIEGRFVNFNESALTDLQILCYYAYSALYTSAPGGNDQRGTLLSGKCTVVTVSVQPGAVTLAPSATQQFGAAVLGAENVNVTWTATGGTITATGLFTAGPAAGTFRVRAISVADPNVFADATVTVTLQGVADVTVEISTSPSNPGLINANVSMLIGEPARRERFDVTRPIADISGFLGALQSALSGVTEISDARILLDVPVSLTISFTGFNVGRFSADVGCGLGAQAGGSLNVTLGNTGILSARACASTVAIAGGQASDLAVSATGGGTVNVSAGAVENSLFVSECISSTVAVSAGSVGRRLALSQNTGCNGTVSAQPTGLVDIQNNVNSTFGAISAGDLNELFVTRNTGTSFTLNAGNIVNFPTNSALVIINDNTGVPLSAINFGNVEGPISINRNRGFTDQQAQAFANARTVVGPITISGNQP